MLYIDGPGKVGVSFWLFNMYEHMNKSKVLKKPEQKKISRVFFQTFEKNQTDKATTVGERATGN